MTGLALPALGLAQQAIQAMPALFADLHGRVIPPACQRIESIGHARAGCGAASYVCDALSTPALAAEHPRFAFRDAGGRIFRLLPEGGSVAVEQGGAAGDGETDDQGAVQAAIDYAEAIGASEVRFGSPAYRIDCPARASPADRTHAADGHPLVVRRSLILRGSSAVPTVLDFRAPGGADPETNWQTVPATASPGASQAVWRGGGLFVLGELADPGAAPRRIARLELHRLILQGNRRHTGRYAFPADPATGDGWDITDKALWLQDCYAGTIVCRDVAMIGWKGEIFYLAGAANAVEEVRLDRCRFETGNASAFNPSVDARIVARDCRFGDCFQAQEDVAKTAAHYRDCTWFDCDHMGLGSGPCDGVLHNSQYPTRDPLRPVPQTLLDGCEFSNIRSLAFASWVRGSIRTIDTTVTLDGKNAMALRDTDLAVEAWLDRKAGIHALALVGPDSLTDPVPGAPEGTFRLPPTQVRVRIAHHRTALAEEAGREWLGCYWTGYIARTCSIAVSGNVAGGRLPNGGVAPLSMPRVTYSDGEATSQSWPRGWFRLPTIGASGEIAPAAPLMTIEAAGEIAADLTLARTPAGGAAFGYADGQRIRFVKQGGNGTLRFVKGAADGTAVIATRVLASSYDWIEFTYNRDWQRWEERGFFTGA